MKDVCELLREADPLKDDFEHLYQARDEMRRRVVATSSTAQTEAARDLLHRRLTLALTGTLVLAVVVFGVLVSPGDRGTLQAAVRFEARLAETQPVPGFIVARVGNSDRVIYLRPEAIVTNEDIAQRWVTQDGPNRYGVSVSGSRSCLRAADPLLMRGFERLGDLVHLRRVDYVPPALNAGSRHGNPIQVALHALAREGVCISSPAGHHIR